MSKEKLLEVEREHDELVVKVKLKEFRLLPEETKKHVVGAGREALLAIRSLLDSAISRTGETPEAATAESIPVG